MFTFMRSCKETPRNKLSQCRKNVKIFLLNTERAVLSSEINTMGYFIFWKSLTPTAISVPGE